MSVIETHKAVYITYVILDEAGKVLEQNDIPVGYVHGVNGPLFPKVEAALTGHAEGDTVEAVLPPDEAFGPRDPSLAFTDDINNVPPELRHVGATAEMQNEHGESRIFHVTHVDADTLTVDANHPLAGKTLTFRVTVQQIREATADEIQQGVPADMHTPTIN